MGRIRLAETSGAGQPFAGFVSRAIEPATGRQPRERPETLRQGKTKGPAGATSRVATAVVRCDAAVRPVVHTTGRPRSEGHFGMSIHVTCPNGHSIRVKTEAIGRRVTCPRCQLQFRVPADAAAHTGRDSSLPRASVIAMPPEGVAALPRAVRYDGRRASGAGVRPAEPPRPHGTSSPSRSASTADPAGFGSPFAPASVATVGHPPSGSTSPEAFAHDNPFPSEQDPDASGPLLAAARTPGPPRRSRSSRQASGRRTREIIAGVLMLALVAAVAAAGWWVLEQRGVFKGLSKGRPQTGGLP